MLRINGVSKRFGSVAALNDVDIKVKGGEIFSLIGPNGSGKTTLIKTVAGLLRQDQGTIAVDGYDTLTDPLNAKALMGYIPDEPTVWSGMTGEEFLHMVGALFGVHEADRMHRIPDLLDLFHLKGLEKGYFEEYSRGNKQKFSILAALLHRPKLLLIDEPIVGLDPDSAEIAKRVFYDFSKKGGSVLLVTHTLPVAEEIASRIGILKNGLLVGAGSLHELRHEKGLDDSSSLEDVYHAYTS